MRVDLVGTIGVVTGSGSVVGHQLGGRRNRVVLAALALAERGLTTGALAAMVWPDAPPPSWAAALRGVVRGLRTALEPIGARDLVVTTPSGYGLAATAGTDVAAAAAGLRAAERALADGDAAAAVAAAAPAADLDGAALLAGEDLDWLAPHRRAIDERRLRALEVIATAAGRLANHAEAIDAARRAVALAPIDERAHGVLIGVLDAAGDRAGAVLAYERCRAALADELGVDPSPATVERYLAALGRGAPARTARLPVDDSTFIGRGEEVARCTEAIAVPGLVTLTGKGGVGKSRIARQVATAADGFDGGRLWVSVGASTDDELVASTVATAIGALVGAEDPADRISRHLAPLGRVLLVVDGCEVALDGAASLLHTLRAACPTLSVIATSRLPLGVDGEVAVTIAPLAAPQQTDHRSLAHSAPVQLLADRVRAAGGTLAVTEETAPLVAAVCRRCGGLPLALELVAAQLAVMSVADLTDHLAELPGPGVGRDTTALRTVLAGSYALLSRDEAAVCRRLAVLDGAASLPIIRTVVSTRDVAPIRVVRLIRELTARGLLRADRSGPRWRYQQDDDLRTFAAEMLVDAGEESATFERLFTALRALLPEEAGAPPESFRAAIAEVFPSVRSLLGAAVVGRADRDLGLELAFRLHRYWAATDLSEGRFWLGRLLIGPPSPWVGRATFAHGYLSYWAGDSAAGLAQLQAAVPLLENDDDRLAARALLFLGGIADDFDRGAEAVEHLRRALEIADRIGALDLRAGITASLASVLADRDDPTAPVVAADAVERSRAVGNADQLLMALSSAAQSCWQIGSLELARGYVAEAVRMPGGSARIARVLMLEAHAGLALADGDVDGAVRRAKEADAVATELGVARELCTVRSLHALALLRSGDVPAAAGRALAAIDAAAGLTHTWPLALCLETATLVALARGEDRATLGGLLATAAAIRAAGERPPPRPLRATIERARQRVDAAAAMPVPAAVARARTVLSARTPVS